MITVTYPVWVSWLIVLLAAVEVFGLVAKWRLHYWTKRATLAQERSNELDSEWARLADPEGKQP